MRIHLADSQSSRFMLSMIAGHPYKLISYFYLRREKEPASVLCNIVDNPANMIIDSGLFSFMFGSEQGTIPSTLDAYLDYTKRYLDDLDRWGYKGFVVEADAQRLLGVDACHLLREEFAPLGDRVIYVWHEPDGLDGLDEMARRYSYIAIGAPELRRIISGGSSGMCDARALERATLALLSRIHGACNGKPPRVHLLGCTVSRLMETTLAWSCDSTSWLAGLRFGSARVFDPKGYLLQVGIRSKKFIKYRDNSLKHFPDVAEFASKQKNPLYYMNCFACAMAFADYQRWLDAHYTNVPMRGAELPSTFEV